MIQLKDILALPFLVKLTKQLDFSKSIRPKWDDIKEQEAERWKLPQKQGECWTCKKVNSYSPQARDQPSNPTRTNITASVFLRLTHALHLRLSSKRAWASWWLLFRLFLCCVLQSLARKYRRQYAGHQHTWRETNAQAQDFSHRAESQRGQCKAST